MAKNIWNLMYVAGNPSMFSRVTSAADNPMSRAKAMECALNVVNNGGCWRVWVEHKETGERIFESEAEKEHGGAQVEHQREDAAMFEFDGSRFTLEAMLDSNVHDDDFCAWVRSAVVGDNFCGCVRVS